MSATNAPYGLRPINLIGGQAFNGGVIREFKVAANNSAAIFNGDLVVLSSAGLPSAVGTTPTAIKIPSTSADATAGIVGVCVGARFVDPVLKQQQFAQYLPANTITGGYTDVWVRVMDDPDALFQIQGTAALGTFNSGTGGSGWPGAIGKNAALDFSTAGSTTTGNSGARLLVGTNGGSLAATSTLAVRIVDVVAGTTGDAYPEFIVKLNVGVHSYTNSLGV
jgi:hypothetical protein